jgi:hypothetical protein
VTVTEDATTSSEFTISGISLPATIRAGQRVSFRVTFAPRMGGAASGRLDFKTRTAEKTAIESVSGTGVSRKTYTVALRWDASTSKVSGYNIYRAETSRGRYSKLNSRLDEDTDYVDRTVSANRSYYYVTRAVNSRGQESRYSNQVRVEIP